VGGAGSTELQSEWYSWIRRPERIQLQYPNMALLAPNLKLPRSVTFNIAYNAISRWSVRPPVDYIRNVKHSFPAESRRQLRRSRNTFNARRASRHQRHAAGVWRNEHRCRDKGLSQLDPGGATIADFAGKGLGSPANGLYVQTSSPTTASAFAGKNPNFGPIMLSDKIRPLPSIRGAGSLPSRMWPTRSGVCTSLTWAANYNLSRNSSTAPIRTSSTTRSRSRQFQPPPLLWTERTGPHPHVQFCEHF